MEANLKKEDQVSSLRKLSNLHRKMAWAKSFKKKYQVWHKIILNQNGFLHALVKLLQPAKWLKNIEIIKKQWLI